MLVPAKLTANRKRLYNATTKIRMNDKNKLTIIYYASTGDFANAQITASAEREAQIAADPDELKLQRRLAWIVLQRATELFAETTGIAPPQICIAGNGRPQATGAYVSVAHCDVAVVAAVSQAPVGVDCEPTNRVLPQNLADRIALPQERRTLPPPPPNDTLLRLWTAKEAAFKAMPTAAQPPVVWKVDTTAFTINSFEAANAVISVATPSQTEIVTRRLTPNDIKDSKLDRHHN